jgi:DNA repair exonuclease SbcCD ATPase subunit
VSIMEHILKLIEGFDLLFLLLFGVVSTTVIAFFNNTVLLFKSRTDKDVTEDFYEAFRTLEKRLLKIESSLSTGRDYSEDIRRLEVAIKSSKEESHRAISDLNIELRESTLSLYSRLDEIETLQSKIADQITSQSEKIEEGFEEVKKSESRVKAIGEKLQLQVSFESEKIKEKFSEIGDSELRLRNRIEKLSTQMFFESEKTKDKFSEIGSSEERLQNRIEKLSSQLLFESEKIKEKFSEIGSSEERLQNRIEKLSSQMLFESEKIKDKFSQIGSSEERLQNRVEKLSSQMFFESERVKSKFNLLEESENRVKSSIQKIYSQIVFESEKIQESGVVQKELQKLLRELEKKREKPEQEGKQLIDVLDNRIDSLEKRLVSEVGKQLIQQDMLNRIENLIKSIDTVEITVVEERIEATTVEILNEIESIRERLQIQGSDSNLRFNELLTILEETKSSYDDDLHQLRTKIESNVQLFDKIFAVNQKAYLTSLEKLEK